MKTKKIKISELTPDNINANKGTVRGSAMLERSLREYGAGRSVLVDKAGRIIAGNKTIEAAGSIGLEDAVVVETDGSQVVIVKRTDLDLDSPQGRGLAIADNRVAEVGLEWDLEALEKIGEELDLSEFWFDDELPEIDFSSIDEDEDDELAGDADAVPEVEDVPTSKRGDLWILGEHRVLCGDSTNADDVARLMNGEKADICFTSPPYNAGHIGKRGDKSTQKKYDVYDDSIAGDDYMVFLSTVSAHALRFCDELFLNIGLVEGNKRQMFELITKFSHAFKDIIYWKKSSVAPHIQPGVINNLVEMIICFGDGKRKFKNAQFSQGSYWNVIEGSSAGATNNYADIHKATFPLYLPLHIIKNFSNPSGSVLDVFMGTGTTLIAAEKTSRKCYGMEISPQYVDVIVRRWQDYTGKEATHEDGRTFAQVAEERASDE